MLSLLSILVRSRKPCRFFVVSSSRIKIGQPLPPACGRWTCFPTATRLWRESCPLHRIAHQAPEGRSRDGGLRFGEMERDCIIAHGMARFLKERLLETADIYSTYVCMQCGLFAQRLLKRDNKPYATKKDIYHCPSCNNKTRIAKVQIPYAFKLLLQEMMAMNVAPRLRIKRNKFSLVYLKTSI